MYPLTLIRISKGRKIEVELKNNEIYAGVLVGCDLMMNMCLKNVTVRNKDTTPYFLLECNIKGSIVKHINLDDRVMAVQKNLENREKNKGKKDKKPKIK